MILSALVEYEVADVVTLAYNSLGRDADRAELVAIRRAARRLAEDGRVRAIYLGCCLKCGELSETWSCSKCRCGCSRRLVVTPTDGLGATIRSIPSLGPDPRWVSVVSASSVPEATLIVPADG